MHTLLLSLSAMRNFSFPLSVWCFTLSITSFLMYLAVHFFPLKKFSLKGTGKGKVVLVPFLTEHHAMKAYR